VARLTAPRFKSITLGALGALTLSALPACAATEPASWPAKPPAATAGAQLYLLAFADQDIAQVAGQVLGVMLGTPFEPIPPSTA
jgi:type II secretory pathway component GspD/PulD (secretin)